MNETRRNAEDDPEVIEAIRILTEKGINGAMYEELLRHLGSVARLKG